MLFRSQKLSDLLDDYLVNAEFVDEDGRVVKGGGKKRLSLKAFLEENGLSKPDCFGFADDGAPECDRCQVYMYCSEDRVENLPPCYGLKYNDKDTECAVCLEAPFCKEGKKEIQTKNKNNRN